MNEHQVLDQLIQVLKAHFNVEELALLYFSLFGESTEVHSKITLILKLVEQAKNQQQIPELMQLIQQQRPKIALVAEPPKQPVVVSTPHHPPPQSPRHLAVHLLKRLLPSQFDEVLLNYQLPSDRLSGGSRFQKSHELIEYALQKEGEQLTELLQTIYHVAPHLKR